MKILALLLAGGLACSGAGQNLTWNWSNPQPHGNTVVGMAWNGSLGVQVCDRGQVYTSPDLVHWAPQNSRLTNDLEAVTFFGKRIVITGAYGAVAYSDDGTNFTALSLNTTNWLNGVAASAKLAVAVGDNGVIYTSTNGADWVYRGIAPDTDGDWLYSVAYGNGTFVTVGDLGYIATSGNGADWSAESIAAVYGDLENVTWINGSGSTTTFPYAGFWAVGDNYTSSGDSDAFYSVNNGADWVSVNFDNPSTNVLFTVAADGATALLAGNSEARLGSVAAKKVTWPNQVGPALTAVPPGTYYASLAPANGLYTLAGDDGLLVQSYLTNNGAYAWDVPYYSPRDWLFQVTVANGLYVAVGDNVRIMTSADGAAWSVEEVVPTNSISAASTVFLAVGGTTNLLLAVGTGGSLAASPYSLVAVTATNGDGSLATNIVSSLGVAWYGQAAPAGTTNDLAGIGRFNDTFFLVGANGTLLSSPDGTNWSQLDSGTTNYLSGIAATTNGLLVLTGNEGVVLTSTNGANWTSRATGTTNWLYRVQYLAGRLLAVGENGTLLTSANGANWTKLDSGVTNFLNDAVLVGSTGYVVGDQGVVLASTNFINWTKAGTITTKTLESAATQNGQLVVAGFEGTILRSQIIPQPVNFIQYAQTGGYNLFSVAGTVNEQFTLDSSTNLADWVTGPLLNIIYGDGTLIFYQDLPARPAAQQFYRCTLAP